MRASAEPRGSLQMSFARPVRALISKLSWADDLKREGGAEVESGRGQEPWTRVRRRRKCRSRFSRFGLEEDRHDVLVREIRVHPAPGASVFVHAYSFHMHVSGI